MENNAQAPSEKSNPDIAIFPNNDLRITTPAGREYRGRILHHDDQRRPGEKWIQVLGFEPVARDGDKFAQSETTQFADTALRKGRPDYFPERSTVKPLDIAFNRIPPDKRTDKNQNVLMGELWDQDGLWILIISPSGKNAKTLYNGSAVPHKAELAYPRSTIAQFQRLPEGVNGGEPEPDQKQARAGARKRVQPKAEEPKTDPA